MGCNSEWRKAEGRVINKIRTKEQKGYLIIRGLCTKSVIDIRRNRICEGKKEPDEPHVLLAVSKICPSNLTLPENLQKKKKKKVTLIIH